VATVDRILALKLVADVGSINKEMKGVRGTLAKTASAAKSWGKAIAGAVVIRGIEEVGDALDNAWDGFREGEKAAGQLENTWGNLDLGAAELGKVLDEIGATALRLGTDDTEAIMAFNRALQTTGDSGEAMDRLNIALDLVANGSAPNLSAAMRLIQGAAKGSAKVVDQFGLTAKTAKGRVRQLREAVAGAAEKAAALDPLAVSMNTIGEAMETISGALSKQDLAGVVEGLGTLGGGLAGAAGSAGVLSSILGEFGGSVLAGVTLGVVGLGVAIATTLLPALVGLAIALAPVWITLGVAAVAVGAAVVVVAALVGWLQNAQTAAQDFGAQVGTAVGEIQTALQDLQTKVQPILDGISQAFDGAAGHIANLLGTISNVINTLISAWNALMRAINGERSTQGTPFDFGRDPFPGEKFAAGGIVRRPTIGLLGEAGPEAVIPLSRLGGLGGVTIIVNAGIGDPVEIGRQVDRVLRAYRGRSAT